MPEIIPQKIEDDEILVRFLTTKNIKRKKPIELQYFDDTSVFYDIRGVSMQRESYCNELECKGFASKLRDPKYIGFVVFYKKDFLQVKKNFLLSRPNFEAKVLATPLNSEFKLVISSKGFYKGLCENPAHSDLFYIEPALLPDEGTPNPCMRSFSRKLIKYSKIVLDKNPNDLSITPCKFKDLFVV